MTTRVRYVAEYSYPGMLFPETTSREVSPATFEAAVAAAPDEDGYFTKDGWYAVRIDALTEKRFVADDGDDTWVLMSRTSVGRFVIGQLVHYTAINPDEGGPGRNSILISNIRINSKDGYGVRTCCGNWQIADDYDTVIGTEAVAR